jgi:hypothetical protein
MAKLRRADSETMDLMVRVMRECHKELVEAKVRVGILFASVELDQNGRPMGIPVRCHGTPAAAKVKLISRRKRLEGIPFEAIIEIDEHRWDLLTEEGQEALLDHELTHLQLKRDKDSNLPIADDDGRPKLKMRPDDWSLTGFADVVRRRGHMALEAQSFKELYDRYGQMLFPWMETVPA